MRKKIGTILSCILILCMFAGCDKATPDYVPTPTDVPEHSITLTPNPSDSEKITVAPSKTTELPIYTISGDFTELMAVTALVSVEEITEQVVTEAVTEALAGGAIYVTVNRVTHEADVITVDFSSSTPPVSQVGASIEGLILDAYGQSLLDNIPDCKGISFTVDGGNYASGHFEFDENYIYMRR